MQLFLIGFLHSWHFSGKFGFYGRLLVVLVFQLFARTFAIFHVASHIRDRKIKNYFEQHLLEGQDEVAKKGFPEHTNFDIIFFFFKHVRGSQKKFFFVQNNTIWQSSKY